MKNLELAVKVVADEFKNTIDTMYNGEIEDWNDMLRSFGWDSEDAKEEMYDILNDYADQTHEDVRLTDDYEFVEEDGEILSYRKFSNLVRKQLF